MIGMPPYPGPGETIVTRLRVVVGPLKLPEPVRVSLYRQNFGAWPTEEDGPWKGRPIPGRTALVQHIVDNIDCWIDLRVPEGSCLLPFVDGQPRGSEVQVDLTGLRADARFELRIWFVFGEDGVKRRRFYLDE